MSDKPISDLRRRMIADMTVRSFSDKTQREYIRQIETFARFLRRSPDSASGDDIRRFQLAQVEQGAQPPKMNAQASALRFFLTITLGRADLAHQLARTHYPRKLPRALAADQVARSKPRPALVSSTRPRSALLTAPVYAAARSSCCGSATSIPSAC
jgi:integrase/recombinase XerD